MKKIATLLLAVCMCISVTAFLVACENEENHEHTYRSEWSYNNLHHWHECSGQNCNGVSDKAEHAYSNWTSIDEIQHKKVCECGAEISEPHNWDDGETIKTATPEANGIKKYVCTICSQTKNEAVEYVIDTIVTQEEWIEALSKDKFLSNGILNLTVTQSASYDGEQVHLFADGKKKSGETVSEDYDIDDFVNSDFGEFFEYREYYSRFSYDDETTSYKYGMKIGTMNISMAFQFVDNKLYSYTIYNNLTGSEQWTKYIYTDIGSTTIGGISNNE